ncbi:MAG: helix-turn-helix domain-containing protein [Tannerella sp.]|jgi:AraC-like DNA-binding protein|nr:helix-turn-helix domain-containing protein [Tannerella sp.]
MGKLIQIDDVWQAPGIGQTFAPLKWSGDDTVDRLSNFVRAAHVKPLNTYAAWMEMSLVELNVLLKRATGMSVQAWCTALTMQDARGLLLCTDKNTETVAKLLHFPSRRAFSNYFIRYQGESPSAYRRSRRHVEKLTKINIRW